MKPSLEDTLALMRDLRARCDWDAAQTHDSLRPYLIEEAYEVEDAIRSTDDSKLREELGDLFLQIVFHSVLAEERGAFTLYDVAQAFITKMRARHPHLYGDGEKQSWERMKAKRRDSIVDGLPVDLPALHRAYRLQDRAAGVGFDWPDTEGPMEKVAEELAEVREELAATPKSADGSTENASPENALAADRAAGNPSVKQSPRNGSPTDDSSAKNSSEGRASRTDASSLEPAMIGGPSDALQDEIGDLLFAVVNLARKAGVHPELALDRANRKFSRRFAEVERAAAERGLKVGEASLAELDAVWDEVKAREP